MPEIATQSTARASAIARSGHKRKRAEAMNWVERLTNAEVEAIARECIETIITYEYGMGHHVSDARKNLHDLRSVAKERGLKLPKLPRR